MTETEWIMDESIETKMFTRTHSCFWPVIACVTLSFFYVSSLYIWKSPHDRNHPSTIKRRFLSVFVMTFISPLFLYAFTNEDVLKQTSICQLLGLRLHGFVQAALIPVILTMVLYFGPLFMQGFNGIWKIYIDPRYWIHNFRNLIWIRNQVVAPLSEEFTFRACMLPLLLQCFKPKLAIMISPLFFGVAHFHHMLEQIKNGSSVRQAFVVSCFQFFYSSVFGAYSAFLFIRTGHFVAPFLVHSFCNSMGLPDFPELFSYKSPTRFYFFGVFVIGLVSWMFLLFPLTQPSWYSNDLWDFH